MPQPLKFVRGPRGSVSHWEFTPGSVWRRPQLAGQVLYVIEQWAAIEAEFLRIGAFCIDGNYLATMAMLQAAESQATQRDLVFSAVSSRVDQEHYRLFYAAMISLNASRNTRNKFVHHLWGVSDELLDVLLLYDPKDYNMAHARHVDGLQKGTIKYPLPHGAGFDLGKIEVWKRDDFDTEKESAKRASSIIFDLSNLISAIRSKNTKRIDSTRKRLSGDSQIREKYERQWSQKLQ